MSATGPPLPPNTSEAQFPKPPETLPPYLKTTAEWNQEKAEASGYRTLGEVMDEVNDAGEYLYPHEARIRAASRVVRNRTELTGANGGPVPIEWVSPVNPQALRKAEL